MGAQFFVSGGPDSAVAIGPADRPEEAMAAVARVTRNYAWELRFTETDNTGTAYYFVRRGAC